MGDRLAGYGKIEYLSGGRQVTAWLGIINGGKARLAETGRILNNFIAFAVALVILIGTGIQRFINGIGTADFYDRAITHRRLRRIT